jgi:hypothetical protein
MTKFESNVRVIPATQEAVFTKISDLSNLEAVRDRLPADKVNNVTIEGDTVTFDAPGMGQLSLKMVEREPNKCVKLEAVNAPLPINIWIQLVPKGEAECKMKVTIGLDINPVMKLMVQKPLTDAIEKIADMLATIPY